MAAGGKEIVLFGVVGVGGYLVYEYMQYNSAVTTLSQTAGAAGSAAATAAAAQIQAAVPFMTFISMNWGSAGTTTLQTQTYNALKAAQAGTLAAPAATPGTTGSGQQTSVSTTPTTTPTTTTTTTPSSMQTLAGNMAASIGMTTTSADHWNVAFSNVMGQGIDAKYGFSFDTVYGTVVNGVRNNGATMSALMFLQLAQAAVPGGLPGLSGFGRIARFPGRPMTTSSNMIFAAHHPTPYQRTFNLGGPRGLGAFTQATGFEKVLWANRPLRSNRVP